MLMNTLKIHSKTETYEEIIELELGKLWAKTHAADTMPMMLAS